MYVSPFVGRLDDRGEDGMDLVRNIKRIDEHSDGHVQVLAASIRSVNQLLCCFALSDEPRHRTDQSSRRMGGNRFSDADGIQGTEESTRVARLESDTLQ